MPPSLRARPLPWSFKVSTCPGPGREECCGPFHRLGDGVEKIILGVQKKEALGGAAGESRLELDCQPLALADVTDPPTPPHPPSALSWDPKARPFSATFASIKSADRSKAASSSLQMRQFYGL